MAVLSICIATYNRAAFIGATLDSIVSQATDELEIVIVDGASIDNTEQVVVEYQKRFPRLRYFRQTTNMGVDRDFNRAAELALGEYCWLMTDDDILKPNAINSVMAEIKRGYGLIIANAEVRNADLSRIIEERRLPFRSNRVYGSEDYRNLFTETAGYLSFIGGVIVNRQVWLNRNRDDYFGTEFIHFGVIFQGKLPCDTIVISEPLISIRYGNALWSARAFNIWMFKWPRLIWSFPNISDDDKKSICLREPWRKSGELLIYRAKGAYTISEYRDLIVPNSVSTIAKLLGWLIARAPGSLINAICSIYFAKVYPHARLLHADLENSRFNYKHLMKRLLTQLTFQKN